MQTLAYYRRDLLRAALLGAIALTAATACAENIEGFCEPFIKIDLAPAEAGILTRITVREGEKVAKGQLLGTLDCEVQQASLDVARATMVLRGRLESAAAERDLRASRFEKLGQLRSSGHASQEEVDRARADLAVAEANVLAINEQRTIDELEAKKIEAMIERRAVRSPIDGVITRVYHEEKEFITAGSSPVLTVVQLDPLRIVFSVPCTQASKLAAGQPVHLRLPDDSMSPVGKVEFVSPVIEADSGTVRVKVLLANPTGVYRAGARCTWEPSTTEQPGTLSRND